MRRTVPPRHLRSADSIVQGGLTRLLTVAALCVGLSGCPDSHGAAGNDAGPSLDRDSALLYDVPPSPVDDAPAPRPDAPGLPDAPGACPLAPFDAFCTRTGNAAVPVGIAHDLEVFLGSIDGCYCGEEIDCTGTLAADGTLELTSGVCTDRVCDACFPRAVGTCHLPPLSEGTYRVRVNGSPAFELTASSVTPFVPVDTCVTVPDGGCAPIWPPVPMAVDSACVETGRAGTGSPLPIPVEVVSGCASCGASAGPCVTNQVSPSEFEVVPQELTTGCDIACPAICMEARHTCWLPALVAGTYTVRVRGIDLPMTIHVGDPTFPTRTCVGSLTTGG